jgi:hypothetical protein
MSSSDSHISLFCFSGVAIVGQTGALSTKTVTLDVEVFLGAEKHSTLLGSLRFFNANNIQFSDFPDSMACLIKASVGFLSSLFMPSDLMVSDCAATHRFNYLWYFAKGLFLHW